MTIDVNIPESVIDEIVERVTDSLDTTSTADLKERVEDLEDLESRLDDLERTVEDIDTKECVNQGEFNDLESRVDDIEKGDYPVRVSELESVSSRLEGSVDDLTKRVQELELTMSIFHETLKNFVQSIRVATDRFQA